MLEQVECFRDSPAPVKFCMDLTCPRASVRAHHTADSSAPPHTRVLPAPPGSRRPQGSEPRTNLMPGVPRPSVSHGTATEMPPGHSCPTAVPSASQIGARAMTKSCSPSFCLQTSYFFQIKKSLSLGRKLTLADRRRSIC